MGGVLKLLSLSKICYWHLLWGSSGDSLNMTNQHDLLSSLKTSDYIPQLTHTPSWRAQ
jgi:hypothetical protein